MGQAVGDLGWREEGRRKGMHPRAHATPGAEITTKTTNSPRDGLPAERRRRDHERLSGTVPHACLLDVREAATMLGLKSPRTLYKWAYAGRIPSVKIGRLLRFRRSDLQGLIAAGERPAFASPDGFPLTARAAAQ